MKSLLLFLVLMASKLSYAQQILVTTAGREYAVESYRISDDGSRVDVRTCLTCLNPIPFDSVAELVSLDEEKIYHLKRMLTPSLKVDFMELVASGKILVYKRKSKRTEKGSGGQEPKRPKSSPEYTDVEQYFLEKDGSLKQVLPTYNSWQEKGLVLKEFVSDDGTSVREIDHANFELTTSSLHQVVADYNARAFEPQNKPIRDARVSFVFVLGRHVTSPLTLQLNGETSPLDRTLLTMQIPSASDSKVCVADGSHSRCQVIRGTKHFTVFFEVHIDDSGQIDFKQMNSKKFSHVAQKVSNARGH